MRISACLELTDEDRATLTMWARSGKMEQRIAKRAQVILQTADGRRLDDISTSVGLGRQSCIKWRKRFIESGVEALSDKPRSGKPATISAEEKASIIALACTNPPDGSNQWSVRKLAETTGHGKTTISTVLSQRGHNTSQT